MSDPAASTPWIRRIGHGELLLRHRYEMASIVNDMLIAVWFIIGSLLFFDSATTTAGVWMFLLGSIELAIRPAIRLIRHVHLRHVQPGAPHDSDQDF
jgi:hypothetical protein